MHVFQCKFSQFFNISIIKKSLLCATQVVRVENGVIFLAHLSRRLTGELIVYPCSVVRPLSVRQSVVHPSFTISKIFSSETAWPIKAKLHVEHP